jgi:hypothetical protein
MKHKLRAPVEGLVFLNQPNMRVSATRGDVVFELESDESKRVVALSVTVPIPPERMPRVRATIKHLPPGAPTSSHLQFDEDKETVLALEHHLQEMESFLAFSLGNLALVRIRWKDAESSLLPESAEEEAQVQFWGFSVKRGSARKPVLVSADSFAKLVRVAPIYRELTIVTSFWREGQIFEEAGQFVQAFYSYYFVIEDMFADGKTGEKAVLAAFGSNAEFSEICSITVTTFSRPNDKHNDAVRRLMMEEGCVLDVPGLQKFLFRIRGNLHHYFSKSQRTRHHPFNQEEFQPVALLVMYMSTLAIARRTIVLHNTAVQQNIPAEF